MTTRHHIFISPHLDDAVLSCGGYIYRLSSAHQRVTVATLATADAEGPLSWVARRNHMSWHLGPTPFASRRKEDEIALGVLGARPIHLGFLDAMYRRDDAGRPLYKLRTTLVPVHPYDWEHQEPVVRESLKELLADSTESEIAVYCPLGTGRHVDHLIVRRAVERLLDPCYIIYYEDQPYSSQSGGISPSLLSDDCRNEWSSVVVRLSEHEIEARGEAVACYESQLPGLFPSEPGRVIEIARARLPLLGPYLNWNEHTSASLARMATSLGIYIERVGGERYWRCCARLLPALVSLEKVAHEI